MKTFCKLFGNLLVWVYHCFDRIVIQGYLPLLTRPEHIVHFFRDVHGVYPITKEVLRKRTDEYQRWVEAFARNHRIPLQWPDPNMKKEDYVRPYCLSMERRQRFGVYFIFKRLDYWTLVLCPKFSQKDRAAINLSRDYSLNQVEYCRNFLFRRNSPIHKLFERSAKLGVFRLTANKIAQIFGVRKHRSVRGKWHSTLEKLDHGHHVLRVYCKSLVARIYEKFETLLCLEICVNRLKDLGLNQGLENLHALRQKLVAVTDRLAGFEAELLNVHVDFPLFQRLALPITCGRTRIRGIKIQDTRMMRLMEVLLQGGPQLHGWRTTQIREARRKAFGIHGEADSRTQFR